MAGILIIVKQQEVLRFADKRKCGKSKELYLTKNEIISFPFYISLREVGLNK